jgi:hypothetical protein
MAKMFEYGGRWIQYENGRFHKVLLDPAPSPEEVFH